MASSPEQIEEDLQAELAALEAKLDSKMNTEVEADSELKNHFQAYNWGLTNMLGAPSDIGTALTNATMRNSIYGIDKQAKGLPVYQIKSPAIGGEQIRQITEKYGLTSPESPKGFTERSARMLGEVTTVLPPALMAGRGLAMQAPRAYNGIEQVLINTYRHRFAAMGAEGLSIAAGAAGGEIASEMYPDSLAAEAIGELTGAVVPGVSIGLLRFTGSKLPITSVVKQTFTESGSKRRAANRVGQAAAKDPDVALRNIMSKTELDLDPMTASQDEGVYALFKAAIEKDHKLLGRMAEKTAKAMEFAKKQLLITGDPEDALMYLKSLRTNAAAKAQKALIDLGPETSPVKASRVVRNIISESHKQARDLEGAIWAKLPSKGHVDFNRIASQHEAMLRSRAVADDPKDVPKFLDMLVGKVDKKGQFKAGMLSKNPTLKEAKILKTRVGREIAEERAKDVPNQNKLRILGDLQETIFDTLSEFSPAYKKAVGYSRSINDSYSKGKVGKLLGFKRSGEQRVPADGTLEFMFSGSKRDVRQGLAQLAESSPSAIEDVKSGVRAMFIAQAAPDGGVVNATNAQRFLRNNAHILDQFPDVKSEILQSIDTQRVVDEFMGANVGNALSTLQKEKAATALYLANSPEKAMSGLLTAKSDAGQGALMRELLTTTSQDATGAANRGLKAAYQQMLLRHAEIPDNVEVLSGKKMLRLLNDTKAGAKELYTPMELGRLNRIATELRAIEIRNATKAAKGGIISDTPNKILSIISGTIAARAGAAAGKGSSGASLRTASIFTKEWNNFMGKLTNDGAEALIIAAVEDPKVMRMLMETATDTTTKEAVGLFNSTLAAQGISMVGRTGDTSEPELSIEDELKLLNEALQQ